jgi:hypothetical protein
MKKSRYTKDPLWLLAADSTGRSRRRCLHGGTTPLAPPQEGLHSQPVSA